MILSPAVLHLLGRQHGLATHEQLYEHLSWRQVKRAVDLELLVPELPKVKRLAGVQTTPALQVMALSLYTGSTGFVGGYTAAREHGVTCVPYEVFEVMINEVRAPQLPEWATVTRTGWRLAMDRRELADGRVVSSPLRTLFRCGAICSDVRFEKIAEQMWHRELITPAEAAEYLRDVRRSGRTGVARFERWLEQAIERPRATQSGLEVDLAVALQTLGLPTPERQFALTLGNAEVIHLDLSWPKIRLGVEPGDNWWHAGNNGTRRDRQRDRACDEIGWHILRFDEVELRDVMACARQVAVIHRKRSRLQQFAGKVAP